MTEPVALFNQIAETLAPEAGIVKGQLFGKPCLKTANKAFSCFFQDEMVFKLGKEEVNQLLSTYPGAQLFDPSGKKRPMKDWLQVPAAFEADWLPLARQALAFVQAE